MTGPAVLVSTSETASSAGTSQSTGTAFVVTPASYGPETPTLCRSLSEIVATFGPRTETASQKLYDWANTFFSLGGARIYVNRQQGAGSPAAAKEELEAGATAKTLVVEAKYKGTFGNKLKVEVVENAGKTASKLIILNPEGEILEQTPEYTKASEIFAWGETHTAYVIIKEGSGYTAGKGSVLKVLASKALSSGANPTESAATTKTALEGLPKSLGPGQLAILGTPGGEAAVQKAAVEHCAERNRVACIDLKEAETKSVTVATLKGEVPVVTTLQSQYEILVASTLIVQGVTAGTSRTVVGSAAVAALRARVSQTGNDNQAPAGEDFVLAPFVTGFTNTFTQAQVEELSTGGINSFKEVNGIPCLYGFVTGCSPEKDKVYWQASATAERMSLVFKAEVIGQGYLFKTIDGRRQLIHKFQADLQGMCLEQFTANALFGNTPQEAFLVNVEEPVNTSTTIQNGELNAELIVRLSPYANVVHIAITSTPVSEAV